MRRCTASGARWRTGSRSSSWTCSPTGRAAIGSWPTSSGCCLSSAAYVLVQALRRTALAGTELAEAQVGTIRLRLLKVAARVVVTARRVVFHLASSYPYAELFRAVFERVMSAAMPGRVGIG